MSLGLRGVIRAVLGFVVYGGIFFGTAGTFAYWEAWAFMGTLFVPAISAMVYFIRTDPEFLERRMRTREERTRQRGIMFGFIGAWLLVVAIPGLDQRFGWSAVPTWLVILADAMVLASYSFVIRVMVENRYASRTIAVDEGQELITTGLYALVRHPMYLGVLPMTVFVPLALGSWVAVIPGLFITPFLVLRILDEEEALKEDLPGYVEYMEQTKSRLVPGVW